MVTVGLYYDVFPEQSERFERKFGEVLDLMRTIDGHRVSYLYRRVDDPHSYAILSEWEEQAQFMAFIRSETFRSVTAWGYEGVLRNPPRHKVYPRSEDMARPGS